MTNGFVVLMGLSTVFSGLITLIILCTIMGAIFKKIDAKKKAKEVQLAKVDDEEIPNRPEFIAAVSAAIAEDLGKDISGIRIVSVKRV